MGGAMGTTGRRGGLGVKGTTVEEDAVGLWSGATGEAGAAVAGEPRVAGAGDPREWGGTGESEGEGGVGAWHGRDEGADPVGSVGERWNACEVGMGVAGGEVDRVGPLASDVGLTGIPKGMARGGAEGAGSGVDDGPVASGVGGT